MAERRPITSFQALYQTHWDREYGGIGGVQYGYGDASAFALDNVIGADPAYQPLASRFGPLIGSQTEANYYGPAPTSQINNSQDLIKLEYNQNFGPSTFLALRYYQVNQENAIFDPNGTFDRAVNPRGRRRAGRRPAEWRARRFHPSIRKALRHAGPQVRTSARQLCVSRHDRRLDSGLRRERDGLLVLARLCAAGEHRGAFDVRRCQRLPGHRRLLAVLSQHHQDIPQRQR